MNQTYRGSFSEHYSFASEGPKEYDFDRRRKNLEYFGNRSKEDIAKMKMDEYMEGTRMKHFKISTDQRAPAMTNTPMEWNVYEPCDPLWKASSSKQIKHHHTKSNHSIESNIYENAQEWFRLPPQRKKQMLLNPAQIPPSRMRRTFCLTVLLLCYKWNFRNLRKVNILLIKPFEAF
eukprot:Sdes_comp19188_c0_seq1m10019